MDKKNTLMMRGRKLQTIRQKPPTVVENSSKWHKKTKTKCWRRKRKGNVKQNPNSRPDVREQCPDRVT